MDELQELIDNCELDDLQTLKKLCEQKDALLTNEKYNATISNQPI